MVCEGWNESGSDPVGSNDITLAGGMGMMEWNTAVMYNLNGGE